MLFYHVAIEGEPTPDPDEISEARFVDLESASELLLDGGMSSILSELR